jgi:hypothetical protein
MVPDERDVRLRELFEAALDLDPDVREAFVRGAALPL